MTKHNIRIEKDGKGFYVSKVVGLPGCHTQAKSIRELKERTKEAIKAYIENDEERELLEPALRPEYVDKMNKIGKQKGLKFKNVAELRKRYEK
jgi:predicted RNase H-like HicB family nuclease